MYSKVDRWTTFTVYIYFLFATHNYAIAIWVAQVLFWYHQSNRYRHMWYESMNDNIALLEHMIARDLHNVETTDKK